MTVEMSAYQKVCLVMGSVRIQPGPTHLNGDVGMNADHMINTGIRNGGNVLMVHAEISQ